MSRFKVEVIADNSGQWVGNGLTFPTQAAAETYAVDLAARWTLVRQWRVLPVADAPRSLSSIAREIRQDWKKVYFGAVPYLAALSSLESISDNYGADSAKSVVLYFLANATTWRGETAKRIKAELKTIAGIK
jgi:hypothetical protein